MRLFLIVLSLIFSPSAFADGFPKKVFVKKEVVSQMDKTNNGSTVLLDKDVIVIRGEINGPLASKTVLAIQSIKGDEATIVIASPGGSVTDGNQIVDAIQASPAKITCIPLIAASMAFVITQACDVRVALPSSILMQHQMFLGMEGQYENVKTRFAFVTQLRDEAVKMQAERMKMSEEAFNKMTLSDVWFTGKKALEAKAVDKIGYARCSEESLKETYKEDVHVFIFTLEVTWSKCPLAVAPTAVKMKEPTGSSSDKAAKATRMFYPSMWDATLIKEINQ